MPEDNEMSRREEFLEKLKCYRRDREGREGGRGEERERERERVPLLMRTINCGKRE